MQVNWQGVYPAISTQFHNDGSINFEANARMLNQLIDDGIDGMSLDRGTVVLCCFDAALAHVKRNEEVPNGGAKNKSGNFAI